MVIELGRYIKYGHSYVVIIPRNIRRQLNLKHGDRLAMRVSLHGTDEYLIMQRVPIESLATPRLITPPIGPKVQP